MPGVPNTAEPELAADDPFADGPPLEQMVGLEEAEARELQDGESPGWDEPAPLSPAAYPGSQDFQQALDVLPAALKNLLHEQFRAEFNVLREIPAPAYLQMPIATKRSEEALEDSEIDPEEG